MRRPLGAHGRAAWTEERLQALIEEHFDHEQVIVLTNREPFRHECAPGGHLVAKHSTGGVVSAMEPLVRACSAVWIAHGSGTADRAAVRDRDGLDIDCGEETYRLRRIWLDEQEERGYYDGAANEALWPLCHDAHVQPVFRSDDLNTYWAVNERFADTVCEEATSPRPFVLVQDYHLALAPAMIRERLPESTIVTFWHIPWPSWQRFEICPWRRHLITGLLGSDIVGVQTVHDCRNFIDCVERSVEAHLGHDRDSILHKGRRTVVRDYPASIEWPCSVASRVPPVERCRTMVRGELGVSRDVQLGVGVDRLDYTKGLVEKFLAVERLFELFPEHCDRFAFAQIAAPSRDRLPAYRNVRSRLLEVVNRINARFGDAEYRPAILIEAHHEPDEVRRFLRAGDLCYVGSLQDGMNLVAKEFVAARDDERGALVLSAFTGAALQLRDALIVNPYDLDSTATTLHRALTMPLDEQRGRMHRMRAHLAEYSAYRWAGEMLQDAAGVASDNRTEWPMAVEA